MDATVESPVRTSSATGLGTAEPVSRARRPRTSLALRLSLPTSLAVVGTMGLVTAVQLAADLRVDEEARRASFTRSLAPLVLDLAQQGSVGGIEQAVGRFHEAFLRQGRLRHVIDVVAADGRSLARAGDPAVLSLPAVLSIRMPLSVTALTAGPVTLVAADVDEGLIADRSRRWRAWMVHIAITAAVLQALLYLVVRIRIAAPIERLIDGVRKMQLGYWRDFADPGGAWELRWLGDRFRAFGEELDSNVTHLVAAQRKAFACTCDAQATAGSASLDTLADGSPPVAPIPALARLEQALGKLRDGKATDPEVRSLARLTWDRLAPQAEELGMPTLRGELEDAALRLLDPAGWRQVAFLVEEERPRLEALALARAQRLQEAIRSHGIACIAVEHRVKHSAGVWRKMQHKGLELRQIHDLVAVRIIVATETDCYLALRAVQGCYPPILGRFKDYIAAPKANGYRSLHMSVRDGDGEVFEVQIRSLAMHRQAEQGAAAHTQYRTGSVVQPRRTVGELLRAAVRWSRPAT